MYLPVEVKLYRWNELIEDSDMNPCLETIIDNLPMDMIDSDKNYFILISYSIPGCSPLFSFLNNQSDHNIKKFLMELKRI